MIYLSQMTLVCFGVIGQGKMRPDVSYRQETELPDHPGGLRLRLLRSRTRRIWTILDKIK
jgi:hypothetical protein